MLAIAFTLYSEAIAPIVPGGLMLEQKGTAQQEQDFCRNSKLKADFIQLSKNSHRFAVNYSNQRIGTIRQSTDCWVASASIQCGAIESRLPTNKEAIHWLIKNFLRVDRSGIKVTIDCENCHYVVFNDSWEIEIDVFDEYCRSIAMQNGVISTEYRYFPDLNSAIACSFIMIMNPGATVGIPSVEEF